MEQKEPRRPASKPQAQALPLSPWGRRAVSLEKEKVGQCHSHGSGVWEVGSWHPFPPRCPRCTSVPTVDQNLLHPPHPSLLPHSKGIEGLEWDSRRKQGQPSGDVGGAKVDVHLFPGLAFKREG